MYSTKSRTKLKIPNLLEQELIALQEIRGRKNK